MPKKETLIRKLTQKPTPKNFTTNDLDALMSQCNCAKYSGGRGSAIGYFHEKSKRKLIFDGPIQGTNSIVTRSKRYWNSSAKSVKSKEVMS